MTSSFSSSVIHTECFLKPLFDLWCYLLMGFCCLAPMDDPVSFHQPLFNYTDTDTEWQTHYLCLRLCVCLLMCDNANITLEMSSPGMLSADTRFTPDCWKSKQVSSEWTGQGSSTQPQPFTAVTQTPFLPSILHNPALNFQTFDLWSNKERERESAYVS